MKCGCGKKLLAAAAVFAFKVVLGMVLCGGIFSWVYRLAPVNVWRPMTGAPSWKYFLATFVLSMIFVFVYKIFSKALCGFGKVKAGLIYGLCVWAVGLLPGMVATHVFMTVNTTVVVYWTVLGLIQTPLEGLMVALIVSDDEGSCCIKK